MKNVLSLFIVILFFVSCTENNQAIETTNYDDMKIRIAEIEIDSIHFDEYIAILKEEAANSVKSEEGVLCIYPMYQKDNPTQIRLLEIYENDEAYQLHLKTDHFLYYKTTTLPMVKSLELIDIEAINRVVK